MTISYVGQGGASAVTTATAPPYPASIVADDILILWVTSDAAGIGSPSAGWTELLSETSGGGIFARVFYKQALGTEAGTVTVSAAGTKGVAYISQYRGARFPVPVSASFATDTDTSSTAYSATSSSLTSATGNLLVEEAALLAPSGSYSSSNISPALSQSGATVSFTSRFSGRTGTNTIIYQHGDASVTSGGSGAVTVSGTAAGANAAGLSLVVVLTESVITSTTDYPVGVTDSLLPVVTFVRSFADNAGITDSLSVVKDLTVTITDSVGISDATVTVKGAIVALSDGVGVTDTDSPQNLAREIIFDNSVNASDSVNLSLVSADQVFPEYLSAFDDLQSIINAIRVTSDSVGIVDTLVALKGATVSITDSVGLSDNIDQLRSWSISVDEFVSVRDRVTWPGQLTDGSIQDIEFFRLSTLGYTGSLYDMRYKWLQDQVSLANENISIRDLEFAYLRGLGYTGSIADMRQQSQLNSFKD